MHTHKNVYGTDISSVFEGVGDTIIYIWKWAKDDLICEYGSKEFLC